MRPPESWASARLTLALTLVTAALFALTALLRLQDWAIAWGGFIPARFSFPTEGSAAPVWLTPLTATLVHAGFVHLAFNLLIFLFCGRSVESILGGKGLLTLYVLGAYVAAAAHYAMDLEPRVPMVGASGAISAVIGAYAMLFGRNPVRVAHPQLALWLHALWLMAAWVGLQLLMGFTFETIGARLAIGAHIGGFIAGVILARPLLLWRYRKA